MIRLDYDLREFQRVLLNVKAFGREATDYELANDQPYYFEGPILTRMSAEQLWDSFVSLSIPYADERVRDQKVIKENSVDLPNTKKKWKVWNRRQWFAWQAKGRKKASRY